VNVVIAGGGTAGHVFPAVALAQRLVRDHDAHVRFIGTARGLEHTLVPAEGFELIEIDARPFTRSLSLATLKAPLALRSAAKACRAVTKAADVVVGVGGYASAPALLAAGKTDTPIVLHEQNAIPGAANRLFSTRARVVALSFAEARQRLGGRARDRAVLTGNPVRARVLRVPGERDALRAQAFATFGLDRARKTLVVFGGSQGARDLNRSLVAALAGPLRRNDLQVLLLAGKAHADTVSADLAAAGVATEGAHGGFVRVLPFLEQMELAYAAADVLLTRAGATTIAELTVCGVPAILVPYPHATANHQEANARALERAGAAQVLLQDDITPERIAQDLARVLDDEHVRTGLARAAAAWAHPEADRALADIVVRIAQGA